MLSCFSCTKKPEEPFLQEVSWHPYRTSFENAIRAGPIRKKLSKISVLRQFSEAVCAPHRGPFGHTPRFVLISMASLPREEWRKLGTYGVIKNARLFLAGMLKPAPMAAEDYGYCMEKLILKATELGLGTCWLGGTFSIGAFGLAAGLQDQETLPCISPIGYAAERRTPVGTDHAAHGRLRPSQTLAGTFFQQ